MAPGIRDDALLMVAVMCSGTDYNITHSENEWRTHESGNPPILFSFPLSKNPTNLFGWYICVTLHRDVPLSNQRMNSLVPTAL